MGSCRPINASKETFTFQQKQKRPDHLKKFVYENVKMYMYICKYMHTYVDAHLHLKTEQIKL